MIIVLTVGHNLTLIQRFCLLLCYRISYLILDKCSYYKLTVINIIMGK